MVLAHGDSDVVLSNERLRASIAIRDWILSEAREIGERASTIRSSATT
jgi:hypothetical protein